MLSKPRQIILLVIAAAVLLTLGVYLARCHCPAEGIAFSRERRLLHRLKNRTALPQPADFDNSLTLEGMVKPGDDQTRWSTSRAARLEGYVVAIEEAKVELANCYLRRDIHIDVALRPDAPAREHVVVEITPRMQEWANRQGWDWSEARLKKDLLGRRCSFEGWLFFDKGHVGEAENTAPGTQGNWRATAWEIHPVTKFEVVR